MTTDEKIQILLDREAIRECIYRYCRGVDRGEQAQLEQTYWPDAVDNHLRVSGSRAEIMPYLLGFVKDMRTQHLIGNIMIEFEGADHANVESYYVAYHEIGEAADRKDFIVNGRYLDRFEKRGDVWKIKTRTLTLDLYSERPATSDWQNGIYANNPQLGARYPEDLYYKLFNPLA